MFAFYHHALHTRPILTKSITLCILVGTGDILAQEVEHCYVPEHKDHSLDWYGVIRNSSYGLVVLGPLLHTWFKALSKIAPHIPPHLDPKLVQTKRLYQFINRAKQMIIDQVVYTPIGLSIFFICRSAIDGQNVKATKENVQRNL